MQACALCTCIFIPGLKGSHRLAGERVVIRGKYKKDEIIPNWRAMFAMAGNESFTTREQANAGNRLTRRTAAFHFGQKVLDHNRSLLEDMKAEMPTVIWVCSWALKVGFSGKSPGLLGTNVFCRYQSAAGGVGGTVPV